MRAFTWSFVVVLLLGLNVGQTRAASVTLVKIVEKRDRAVEKTTSSSFDRGITVTLHVAGADVKDARKVGDVTATRAVDDLGTDLTKEEKSLIHPSKSFDDIRQPAGSREQQADGFDVELRLPAASKREAKTIKAVSGSMQVLVGGEKKVVEIKQLKQHIGTTIDEAVLASAGIKLTLPRDDKTAGDAVIKVQAEFSGDLNTLGEVKIVDKAGKKLNTGHFYATMGGKRSVTYDLDKPLPDDAIMQIEVWPGQKTVTVPIELKDVKLP